jgi:hypothetical protein
MPNEASQRHVFGPNYRERVAAIKRRNAMTTEEKKEKLQKILEGINGDGEDYQNEVKEPEDIDEAIATDQEFSDELEHTIDELECFHGCLTTHLASLKALR